MTSRTKPPILKRGQVVTRGLALIFCRAFLGPSGHARVVGNACCLGTFAEDGWQLKFAGHNWRDACRQLSKSVGAEAV